MKRAVFIIMFFLLLTAASARMMEVRAIVGQVIHYSTDISIENPGLLKDEPLIFDISIESKGNLAGLYFLIVQAEEGDYRSLIGFVDPGDNLDKKIAVPVKFSNVGKKKISYYVGATNFRTENNGKIYEEEVTLTSSEVGKSDKISIYTSDKLVRGDVNNVVLVLENKDSEDIHKILIYSNQNETGTNYIGKIESGEKQTANLQIYAPENAPDNYEVEIRAFDSDENELVRQKVIFGVIDELLDVDMAPYIDGEDVVVSLKNNRDSLAEFDMDIEYHNSLFSFSTADIKESSLGLLPKEVAEIRYPKQEAKKVNLELMDRKGELIDEETLHIDYIEMYILAGILLLIIMIAYIIFRNKISK